MWIECLIQHQGPFEYDVPNGDGTFTLIPFARAANSGAQLAEVKNKRHIKFLLEERPQHFREWTGQKPDGQPAMQLSYPEMMAGIIARAKAPPAAPAPEPERKAPEGAPNVMELAGEALRDYAKAIGITNLPPKSTSDDTLRRAILDHLHLQHDSDLEDLMPGTEETGEE
jgi:hypothetical protein